MAAIWIVTAAAGESILIRLAGANFKVDLFLDLKFLLTPVIFCANLGVTAYVSGYASG